MLVLGAQAAPVFLARMPRVEDDDELSDGQKISGKALTRLRKRAGLTQGAAAEAAGVEVVTWQRYEWGKRGLSLEKIIQLATAVGATLEEFLKVREAVEAGDPLREDVRKAPASGFRIERLLPIRDRVQAGAWLMADDTVQDLPRTYPAARDPRFPHAEQWLAEVIGDSMNQLGILEGDLVLCVDAVSSGYFPKTGDIVEVERLRFDARERELTIKQIEVTPGGVILWPRSTNPRWQKALSLEDGAAEEDVEVRIRGLVVQSIRRFAS